MRMLLATFLGGLSLFTILMLLVGIDADCDDCAEVVKDIDV